MRIFLFTLIFLFTNDSIIAQGKSNANSNKIKPTTVSEFAYFKTVKINDNGSPLLKSGYNSGDSYQHFPSYGGRQFYSVNVSNIYRNGERAPVAVLISLTDNDDISKVFAFPHPEAYNKFNSETEEKLKSFLGESTSTDMLIYFISWYVYGEVFKK